MSIPMPEHLAHVPRYARHQQWLLETYGSCRHTPPVGTIAKRADYSGMYMRGWDITGADLTGADLTGADLAYAVLTNVVFTNACLACVDLSFAVGLPIAPVVKNLDAQILTQIENGGALDVNDWHTCETTHCRAGWAVVLAGADGKALEEKYGTAVAGALIYNASTGRIPNFYASNEDTVADMRAAVGR